VLRGLSGDADREPRDQKVTVAEIERYLQEKVPAASRRLSHRDQSPVVAGGATDDVLALIGKPLQGLGQKLADLESAAAAQEAQAVAVAPAAAASSADPVEMMDVPAGIFTMGVAESGAEQDKDNDRYRYFMGDAGSGAEQDEGSVHLVYLDAFRIDKVEVTNDRYRRFAEAVVMEGHRWCDKSEPASKNHTPGEWSNATLSEATQPVVGVDWWDAHAYCTWVGKRLPTEAEWEKAARGTDGRLYPWGNEYDAKVANGTNAVGKTAPVGSYPRGASPYGVLDMAGNAWEWVHDWYDTTYYASAPPRNPPGPASGQHRVLRGGLVDRCPAVPPLGVPRLGGPGAPRQLLRLPLRPKPEMTLDCSHTGSRWPRGGAWAAEEDWPRSCWSSSCSRFPCR
jgi:formylglycine-generating enzyme required for sulfatase activity